MSELTTFLFARPSFAEGMARVLDFGNTLSMYNGSETPESADTRALEADCRMIGHDIVAATSEFERVEKQKITQKA